MFFLIKKQTSFMAYFSLKGMGVALVTPFKADKTVDFDDRQVVREFLQRQVEL